VSEQEHQPEDLTSGVRRDVVDRSNYVSWLAIWSFGLAFLSCYFPILILIALPMSIAVYRTAKHDLARMVSGEIDGQGEAAMRKAIDRTINAIVISIVTLLLWIAFTFWMLDTGIYQVLFWDKD
jgi:hypothetical protein